MGLLSASRKKGANKAASKPAAKPMPKPPATRPAASSASSQPKASGAAEASSDKGAFSLQVEARVCSQCEQSAHEIDRDSHPDHPQRLAWHKIKKSSAGVSYPCGEECYKCFDARRRFFSTLSREELKHARHDKLVDDKWAELRADRVRGGEHRYKQHAVDVDIKTLVQKKDATFGERYHEGTFYTLATYARRLGITYERRGLQAALDDEIGDGDRGGQPWQLGR